MVINETINATITTALNETGNATIMSGLEYTKNVFLPSVAHRFVDLISAPYHYPEMIWMVVPLIFILLIMEFYFGRYKKEELGWNTAVGNSAVLIFIAIDLFRHLQSNWPEDALFSIMGTPIPTKIFVTFIIALEGVTMLFADFFHFIPKKIAFFLCSALPVNLQAYIALVIVYSDNIPLDLVTISAAIIMFILLLLLFSAMHFFEKGVDESGRKLQDQD